MGKNLAGPPSLPFLGLRLAASSSSCLCRPACRSQQISEALFIPDLRKHRGASLRFASLAPAPPRPPDQPRPWAPPPRRGPSRRCNPQSPAPRPRAPWARPRGSSTTLATASISVTPIARSSSSGIPVSASSPCRAHTHRDANSRRQGDMMFASNFRHLPTAPREILCYLSPSSSSFSSCWPSRPGHGMAMALFDRCKSFRGWAPQRRPPWCPPWSLLEESGMRLRRLRLFSAFRLRRVVRVFRHSGDLARLSALRPRIPT